LVSMLGGTNRSNDEYSGGLYRPVRTTGKPMGVFAMQGHETPGQNKMYVEEEFDDAIGKLYDMVSESENVFAPIGNEMSNFMEVPSWTGGAQRNPTQTVWPEFKGGEEPAYFADMEPYDEVYTPKMQGNRKLDLTILPVPEPMSWKPIPTHLPVKAVATMNVEPIKFTSHMAAKASHNLDLNPGYESLKRKREPRQPNGELYYKKPKHAKETTTMVVKGPSKLDKKTSHKGPRRARKSKTKVKGHWKPEEDSQLLRIVQEVQSRDPGKGLSWTIIAQGVLGRSAKQCRERYTLNLDPNIKREKFTIEEDNILLLAYARMGSKWSKIKMELPGRTENMVKNRFKSLNKMKSKRWETHKYQAALKKALEENPQISKASHLREVLPSEISSVVCDVELQEKMDEGRVELSD